MKEMYIPHTSNYNYPILENCLFGAVTLTKNADINKNGYSGYGIGFDIKGSFSFQSSEYGQNVIVVRVLLLILIIKKGHINVRNRSNARIRKNANCRKNVFC